MYFLDTEILESDYVQHKPLPKTEMIMSALQNGMKTIFLMLKSQNVYILVASAKVASLYFYLKVYYEEKAMCEWTFMFTVVKNLEALQQVILTYCI